MARGGSPTPGSAGHGITATNQCEVNLRDSSVKAGSGGAAVADIDVLPQQLTLLPSAARQIDITTPVQAGNPGTIMVQGVTGDVAFLFLGPTIDRDYSQNLEGSFLLGSPYLGPLPLGPITDPAGLLQIPFVAPPMPAALPDGFILLTQLAILSPSHGTLEGGASYTQMK